MSKETSISPQVGERVENQAGDVQMPPLPEPTWMMPVGMAGEWDIPGAFTAAQMREYAQAALAALNAELANTLKLWTVAHAERSEAITRGEELEIERDALRKDAERLNWIERENLFDFGISFVVDTPHDGEYRVDTTYTTAYGLSLRAAIDAAIAQASKP